MGHSIRFSLAVYLFLWMAVTLCLAMSHNHRNRLHEDKADTTTERQPKVAKYYRVVEDKEDSYDLDKLRKFAKVIVRDEAKAMCHRLALRKCGQRFMKVFKLLEYLTPEQSYQGKCTMRKAFYSCMQKTRDKPCHRQHVKPISDKFRKRLADSLWSTRICLLGVKDPDKLGIKMKSTK